MTDAEHLACLKWMRKWDYDLNKDQELLAMKLGISTLAAHMVIGRAREIEARKAVRK